MTIDREIATGKWRGILMNFGIDEKFLRNKHGACPMCGGKDRFRFDDRDGRGTWICNQCGAGDGYDLLQRIKGWTFKNALQEVLCVAGGVTVSSQQKNSSAASKTALVRRIWGEAIPVCEGDPVSKYLERRCGGNKVLQIRHHPALMYCEEGTFEYYPAMVARVSSPEGKGVALHRTYLTEDGFKAPVEKVKKMLSCGDMDGSAVRLMEHGETLGIAEGIETALAASKLFDVPVWSAMTAGLLQKWTPPPEVKKVIVFGDCDESYTGQSVSYELARRLKTKGIQTEVHLPPSMGVDWVDVYNESKGKK